MQRKKKCEEMHLTKEHTVQRKQTITDFTSQSHQSYTS